ncbi:MAG: DNA translocase FtsK, partial [Eubacterium sp.]|nr:DNA translocase FtsK [Eubacterium sp.]
MANNTKQNRGRQAASRAAAEKAAFEKQRQQENIKRIVSVSLFALSVIFFFIAVIKGEGAWNTLHNVYLGLFGWLAGCIFPIAAIALIIYYSLKEKTPSQMISKSIEAVVFVLLLSALIHICQNQSGDDFSIAVVEAFKTGSAEFNGGFFGALIGWILLTLGKVPAVIVDIVLIFVDFMLLGALTIIQFFKGAAKPATYTYEKVAPVINERIEQRRLRKGSIDVPLDMTPPGEEPLKPAKKPKKQAALDVAVEDEKPTTSVPRTLIDEINAANERKRKQKIEEESVQEQPKSIDDIVKTVSEEKPKQPEKPVEEFKVTKEQMSSNVEDYAIPPVTLLKEAKKADTKDVSGELKMNAERLIDTLHSFNVDAAITDISRGPTVTRYELKPASGIRISKITNLSDDIALNLAATNIRIEAPIPGKAAVGIEVPNTVTNTVSMRELIDTPEFNEEKSKLSAGLGKDIAGKCVYCDVSKMPHLLIAGTTGSGKSVCMNSIIVSILYRAKPDEVKFLMIDPKQVEFSKYIGIPHLLVPVVTDPRKAAGALGWAVSEMLQRYNKFSETGVRDIEGYNKYVAKHEDMEPMPKICIFIDELADLMMAAPKEVEDSICRLAQMARAAGMHLVIATQRPSVDVITGLIKANISSRIALTVSSQTDSRTILDASGA